MTRKPKKKPYHLEVQGKLVRAVIPKWEVAQGETIVGEVKQGFEYIPKWSDFLCCWLIIPKESLERVEIALEMLANK